MAFSACCSRSLCRVSHDCYDIGNDSHGGEGNLFIKSELDLPALLLTELDGLVDDVLVVWELGGSEAVGQDFCLVRQQMDVE